MISVLSASCDDSLVAEIRRHVRPCVAEQMIGLGWVNRESLAAAFRSGKVIKLRNSGRGTNDLVGKILNGTTIPNRADGRVPFIPDTDEPDVARGLLAQMKPLTGWRPFAGIYALKLRGEIVYIGKSLVVIERVPQHVRFKEFDEVDCVEVFGSIVGVPIDQIARINADLLAKERALIRFLKPPLNLTS